MREREHAAKLALMHVPRPDATQPGLELVLGAAARGASDIGEILATAERIGEGGADRWVEEWTATAGAAWSEANGALRLRRLASARSRFLCSATYYSTALHKVALSGEPEREGPLWRRQRLCWDRAVELFSPPGERLAIPYEHGSLPGYFFRCPGWRAGERRPLLIANNGSDGATSLMWSRAGAAAAERGYHWMTFDGPGQQAALFERGLAFRPDWEAVLTPVLDAMRARADVAPERVAVLGVGQGGYWVARALAFEHRFAAAVVDPGVLDVSSPWIEQLSDALRSLWLAGEKLAFDREIHLAELFEGGVGEVLRAHARAYGVGSGSPFELYREVARYRLGEEIANITTPLLITAAEGEHLWPGQSAELYEKLAGPKEIAGFRAREGAGAHGELLSGPLRDARIFDWLDAFLGGEEADDSRRPSGSGAAQFAPVADSHLLHRAIDV
jgi:hypothetical protein